MILEIDYRTVERQTFQKIFGNFWEFLGIFFLGVQWIQTSPKIN
jgi:hypothetical protein